MGKNIKMNDLLISLSKYLFISVKRLFRSKKNYDNKIGVLAFKFLGDTVFTIPAIELLIKKSLGKEITIFCFNDSKLIYEIYFANLNCVTLDKTELSFENRIPSFKLISLLRDYKPNKLFDLSCEYKTALASLFSGADELIGFNSKYFRWIFDSFSLKSETPQLIDMNLDPVKKYFNVNSYSFSINPENNRNLEGKILINPFAGWKAKEWNLDKIIKLASDLNFEYNVAIICEENKISADVVNKLLTLNINFILSNSVKNLIEELNRASLVISNDTGSIYIGYILGKATFTIYGPTNPKYSLPAGKNHSYIRHVVSCSPLDNKQYCYTYGGRNCSLNDCMKFLDYEIVKNNIFKFISEQRIPKRMKVS